jgi:undecaprenyl-diphosphatase
MDLIQAIILGIVQGLTEFLPISSTGHLILTPYLFGWEEHPLVFDTTLHLGTAAALFVYFYKDLLNIVSALFKDLRKYSFNIKKYGQQSRLGLMIVVGCIPGGVLGVLFGDLIEEYFRSMLSVAIFVFSGSIVMLLAERFHEVKHSSITFGKSLVIGFFQSIALLPGFSRSGSTISGGMLLGLPREEAARFSFLLSMPIVVAAGLFQLKSSVTDLQSIDPLVILAGFVASALSGFLAISFMLKFVKNHSLYPFIVYRLLLFFLVLYFFF